MLLMFLRAFYPYFVIITTFFFLTFLFFGLSLFPSEKASALASLPDQTGLYLAVKAQRQRRLSTKRAARQGHSSFRYPFYFYSYLFKKVNEFFRFSHQKSFFTVISDKSFCDNISFDDPKNGERWLIERTLIYKSRPRVAVDNQLTDPPAD